MDWLQQHPWVARADAVTGIVHHIGPTRFVILPAGLPPPDLVKLFTQRVQFSPGESATVTAMNSGLLAESADLMAAVGQAIGMWRMWPTFNDARGWKFDLGHMPVLNEPP